MSIIQDLIREGVIVLWHSYKSGSFNDWSGTGNSGVASSTATWSGGGLLCSVSGAYIGVADAASLQLVEGMLLVRADFHSFVSTVERRLISKRDVGGTNYDLRAVDVGITLFDGTNARFLATATNGLRCIAVNFGNGTVAEGFGDGQSLGFFNAASSISVDNAPLQICNAAVNPASYLGSVVYDTIICNRKLSATEHAQLYSEISTVRWPAKYHTYAKRQQRANPAETGIVAGWDMKPATGQVIDRVGGFDGTNYGPVYESGILGDRMRFDGTDDYVDCGNVGTIKTVAFTVNPATTTEDLIDLDGGTHSVEVAAGTVTATGWTAPTIYVDGTASTTLIAGKKQRVVVTTATGIAASSVQLGTETIFLEGTLGDVEFFSDEKSAAWVAQDYLDIAKAVQFKTDWAYQESPASEGGVLHQQIGGGASPFRAGDTTGRFKVETDVVDGEFCKVLTCTTAGDIYIDKGFFFDCTPTEAMYGTFRGWMYKPDAAAITWKLGGTDFDCTANGYGVVWAADESVVVSELGVGSVVSGGTATADAWHRFDTTRAGDGGFVGYVDETSYGTGSDTTTTTSVGMAWSMGVGCKIVLESARAKGPSGITKMLGVVPPLT